MLFVDSLLRYSTSVWTTEHVYCFCRDIFLVWLAAALCTTRPYVLTSALPLGTPKAGRPNGCPWPSAPPARQPTSLSPRQLWSCLKGMLKWKKTTVLRFWDLKPSNWNVVCQPVNSWTRQPISSSPQGPRTWAVKGNPRAKNLDFRGFESSRLLMFRGGISRSIGNVPEIWTQRFAVWGSLVCGLTEVPSSET